MITTAILLPAGTGVKPEEIFLDESMASDSIAEIVGGPFGPIEVRDPDYTVLGYVRNDPGADEATYNYLATALLNRQIRGDVVVVWGDYESEPQDMPEWFVSYLQEEFVAKVAEAYNDSLAMGLLFDFAVDQKVITEEESQWMSGALARYVNGQGTEVMIARMKELMRRVTEFGEMTADSDVLQGFLDRKANEDAEDND